MKLSEASEHDLREMLRQAREARRSGLAGSDAVEAYGIHTEEDLAQWQAEIEAELDRRGAAS